jgi:hypothetical protein
MDLLKRIARRQLSKQVPTHAPRNNTVEVFSLCPRMDRYYAKRGDVTQEWEP